jgi:hypothetical protein
VDGKVGSVGLDSARLGVQFCELRRTSTRRSGDQLAPFAADGPPVSRPVEDAQTAPEGLAILSARQELALPNVRFVLISEGSRHHDAALRDARG